MITFLHHKQLCYNHIKYTLITVDYSDVFSFKEKERMQRGCPEDAGQI